MKTTIKIESEKPFIVLSLEKYEGLIETLEILSENPNIAEELKREKKEFLKGNYTIYQRERKTNKNGIRTGKK